MYQFKNDKYWHDAESAKEFGEGFLMYKTYDGYTGIALPGNWRKYEDGR